MTSTPTPITALPTDDSLSDTGIQAHGDLNPTAARPSFLAGLRAGHYPVVPQSITTAVAALAYLTDTLPASGYGQSRADSLTAFAGRVTTDVLDGQPWPENFAAAAFDAEQARTRADTAVRAAESIREQIGDRFGDIVTDALPDLLDGLRTELDDVLSNLRPVLDALGSLNVGDPIEVADADPQQRAAVSTIRRLRSRYNVVRLAQRAAYRASTEPIPGNSDQSVHGWATVFDSGIHEFSNIPHHGSLPSPVRSDEQMRALAARDDIWIPTVQQMAAAWDTRYTAKPLPGKESTQDPAPLAGMTVLDRRAAGAPRGRPFITTRDAGWNVVNDDGPSPKPSITTTRPDGTA